MTGIVSDPNFWIAVWTCVAAAGAVFSAFFSWRSSRDAANAAQATMYRSLQQEYASHEMHDALHRLSEWYWWFEDQKLDFASQWKNRWKTEPEARALNEARRRVSHFFGAIGDLYDNRLLSKPIARRLASLSGDLVFVVVEPLEKELSPDYNKAQFDTLRSLTGSSRSKPAQRPRPGGPLPLRPASD